MQWLIEDCFQRGDSFELDPTILCRRLLRLNMAAIHTTSISITNVLLDLYTLPDASSVVEGLREECKRVLSAHEGVWSKAAIGELHRVDSTIKESMRLRSFGLIGTNRVVSVPWPNVSAQDGRDMHETYLSPGHSREWYQVRRRHTNSSWRANCNAYRCYPP